MEESLLSLQNLSAILGKGRCCRVTQGFMRWASRWLHYRRKGKSDYFPFRFCSILDETLGKGVAWITRKMLFFLELPRRYIVWSLSSSGNSMQVDCAQLGSNTISPVCTVGLYSISRLYGKLSLWHHNKLQYFFAKRADGAFSKETER